jgi:hypothetical protein
MSREWNGSSTTKETEGTGQAFDSILGVLNVPLSKMKPGCLRVYKVTVQIRNAHCQ